MILYEIYRIGWEEQETLKYYKSKEEHSEERIKEIVKNMNIQMQKDAARFDEFMELKSNEWTEEMDNEFDKIRYAGFYSSVRYNKIELKDVEEI